MKQFEKERKTRHFEEEETTNSSFVYRRLRHNRLGGCCSPNKGCNKRNKRRERNWKSFRKTKYKN